ncbi:HIT family protein [Curtobacterium sp. 'Ferrero']|uniref:HIT family protein n=1 Tax=Curtobacterium sp. 'Ferrero' TaxID=2033654 RepID=UPI001596E62C|nr:HIT family protein [Curtobacterium sp. 'Ferrero']
MTDSDDCDFCAHLAADSFDVVFRGDLVVAVLDAHPINPGHVLVLPTRHAPDFAALDDGEVTELARVAQRADRALRDVLGPVVEGTNLLMSNGVAADQGVPHAHLHVVPRTSDDGFEFREDTTRYPHPPLAPGDRAAIAARMGDTL